MLFGKSDVSCLSAHLLAMLLYDALKRLADLTQSWQQRKVARAQLLMFAVSVFCFGFLSLRK